MKQFPVLLSLIALMACDTPAPDLPARPTLPDAAADTCGAGGYGELIGQDATALERELIMRPVRVIRPGMAITMDFRQDRINFEIDAMNRIASIGCY